jgi:uncharacterized protein YndB with AHSA1/START domain
MKRFIALIAFLLSFGAQAQERAIVKEVVVKATPEQVWQAWTTVDGIKSFFAPGARIEAKPMGLFEIHMNPYAPDGLKGADDMRYLALQEPRFLSFTWNAPPHLADARKHRTVVTVRITPVDAATTKVVINHSAFGDGGQWDQTYDYFNNAWGRVLANLKKRFDEGPVDWTPWLEQMKKATAAAAEKK